jgi:hypothetical protein
MSLRELFINWLTASRFIRALEQNHQEQRQDFQERLGEKDSYIRSMHTEIAALRLENDRMRAILMPLGTQGGRMYAEAYLPQPKKPVKPDFGPIQNDWTGELRQMLKEEETKHGVFDSGRVQEHEQGADDGA